MVPCPIFGTVTGTLVPEPKTTEQATLAEIALVREFFLFAGGAVHVNVAKIEPKRIHVLLAGKRFALPTTPFLSRKGLAEVGRSAVVAPFPKNHLGFALTCNDTNAVVVETDGRFALLHWRDRNYLYSPSITPYCDKHALFEIAERKNGTPLHRLIHQAVRFCGCLKIRDVHSRSVEVNPNFLPDYH